MHSASDRAATVSVERNTLSKWDGEPGQKRTLQLNTPVSSLLQVCSSLKARRFNCGIRVECREIDWPIANGLSPKFVTEFALSDVEAVSNPPVQIQSHLSSG
jgi:hypothetical protein